MKPLVLAVLTLALCAPTSAQQTTHAHKGHEAATGTTPTEVGQSAFATIREIVEILESDPATDWSKVNIEDLRQHLIDMDNVTLHSTSHADVTARTITFLVSGEGAARDSIRRMIAAQARTMNGESGWTYVATMTDTGANLAVTPPDAASLAKAKSLGYIGLVSRGTHHQRHHLMLATGQSPH